MGQRRIADSASRVSGDSPAATIGALRGIQAANKASEIYDVMARKGCSV